MILRKVFQIIRQLTFLLCWTFCLATTDMFSQNNTETLLKEIKTLNGKEYFIKSNDLAELYIDTEPSKAQELIEQLLLNPKLDSFTKQQARTYYLLGKVRSAQGIYSDSYEPLDKALFLFNSEDDEYEIAKCHLAKGIAYTYQGQKENAQSALNQSLELFKDINDINIEIIHFASESN